MESVPDLETIITTGATLLDRYTNNRYTRSVMTSVMALHHKTSVTPCVTTVVMFECGLGSTVVRKEPVTTQAKMTIFVKKCSVLTVNEAAACAVRPRRSRRRNKVLKHLNQ